MEGFIFSRIGASRRICLICDSRRSNICVIRTRRRSVSPVRASPVIRRVMPGFFSAKVTSRVRMRWQRSAVLMSSWMMRLMRMNSVSSINLISPSNILALLGKWRYSAASDTPTSRASAAVVIRSPGPDSSIWASACRICSLRDCFLAALACAALIVVLPYELTMAAALAASATLRELLINVPTPVWVKISSNTACSTRPSIMCALVTSWFTASSAQWIFGSMPP